jgi:hypothetical protein
MKRFLYIIYGLFLFGAARKAVKTISEYEEIHFLRTRDSMRSSWFEIKLVYHKISTVGNLEGIPVKMMHIIHSGYSRRFRCRRASGHSDCCVEVRMAMEKYIKSHGGLGEGVGFSLAPMHALVGGLQVTPKDVDMSEFDLIKEAFYGIPREL